VSAGGQRVLVIGAGVLGATVAAHLAEAGATVTVLEKDTPGAGTSSTSFAWVNANGKEPQAYFALNAAGVRAHHDLAERGAPWFIPEGHLEVAVDEAHERHLRERAERLRKRGYAVQEVAEEEAQRLAPDLRIPGEVRARMFFSHEGHVLPWRYIEAMLERAATAGTKVLTRAEVVSIEASADGGGLARTASGEEFSADVVVSTVGRWTSEVVGLTGAKIPMAGFTEPGDVTVGYLATTNPLPASVDLILTTPWLNIRPQGEGRLMVQALDLDVTADPRAVPSIDSSLAEEYVRRLEEVVPAAKGARIEQIVVGQRAMPADGLTVVGPVPQRPWLYAVATHSGVTLAPFLGRGVAEEVLGGHEPLFDDFRPDRFANGVPAARPRGPRQPGEQ
jgi:D-hydroxyproline dehydrogenase subunit beta